jgi:hypothetical protein
MNRPSWKSLVFVVVIFAALVVTVDQANAWWSGYGGGAVYGYPAVSAWDGYCGSNLYLGCRPGPIRRLLFGPYRWYRIAAIARTRAIRRIPIPAVARSRRPLAAAMRFRALRAWYQFRINRRLLKSL